MRMHIRDLAVERDLIWHDMLKLVYDGVGCV